MVARQTRGTTEKQTLVYSKNAIAKFAKVTSSQQESLKLQLMKPCVLVALLPICLSAQATHSRDCSFAGDSRDRWASGLQENSPADGFVLCSLSRGRCPTTAALFAKDAAVEEVPSLQVEPQRRPVRLGVGTAAGLVASAQKQSTPLEYSPFEAGAGWVQQVSQRFPELDSPQPGKCLELKLGGVPFPFRYVPAGKFTGGGVDKKAEVVISEGFWLAQTELTQAQWTHLMRENPSGAKGEHRPVENVNWEAAQTFIRKANQAGIAPTGWKFVLPTEAQWEHACRAGTSTPYAFGNEISEAQARIGGGGTSEVGKYPPNAWGLQDMHGNVWEWCEDGFSAFLRGGVDPSGGNPVYRILRGGSFSDGGAVVRADCRRWMPPLTQQPNRGFRPALIPAAGR